MSKMSTFIRRIERGVPAEMLARANSLSHLLEDDLSAPEITVLAIPLRGLWAGNEAALALLDDPRWAKVEQTFSHGRGVLALFGDLGHKHAMMPRRFGDRSAFLFGLQVPLPDPAWANALFARADILLHIAAGSSGLSHAPMWTMEEKHGRDFASVVVEGTGLDATEYDAISRSFGKDIRSLVAAIWQTPEAPVRPAPSVVIYNRFTIPGIAMSTAASTPSAQYQPFVASNERVAVSLPTLILSRACRDHRIPVDLGGFSLKEVLSWEPCLCSAGDYGVDDLVFHELTHALGLRPNEPIDAQSLYMPALEYYCGLLDKEVPKTLTRIGMTPVPDHDSGTVVLCLGLALLDEVTTEAAAIELRARFDLKPLVSLASPPRPDWLSACAVHPYRGGLDLLNEFLPGQTIIEAHIAGDLVDKLVAGINKRLSCSAAREVLDLLFNTELDLMFNPEFQAGLSTVGPHVVLIGMIREIIERDDACALEFIA